MEQSVKARAARPEVIQPMKRKGLIVGVYSAAGKDTWDFPTMPVEALTVDFEGILGERHRGHTRAADARVPYLKRGTPIRNMRHVSIVSLEDMGRIADALGLAAADPQAIGANIVTEGIDWLSYLPRGTKLMLDGGAILHVEDQNAPCRFAGKALAERNPGRTDVELEFPKVAKGLRGLVASVEHPGEIRAGTGFEARLPEQWIWR